MPVHAKLEITDDNLTQQVSEFLRNNPKGRAAFTSRSSGSGESTHAAVYIRDGVFYSKNIHNGEHAELGSSEQLAPVFAVWLERTCTAWVGSGYKVFPVDKAPRTARGKLTFYVKLSTPNARAS